MRFCGYIDVGSVRGVVYKYINVLLSKSPAYRLALLSGLKMESQEFWRKQKEESVALIFRHGSLSIDG